MSWTAGGSGTSRCTFPNFPGKAPPVAYVLDPYIHSPPSIRHPLAGSVPFVERRCEASMKFVTFLPNLIQLCFFVPACAMEPYQIALQMVEIWQCDLFFLCARGLLPTLLGHHGAAVEDVPPVNLCSRTNAPGCTPSHGCIASRSKDSLRMAKAAISTQAERT